MMTIELSIVAGLLLVGVLALLPIPFRIAHCLVYGASLALCGGQLILFAYSALLDGALPSFVELPLGLPLVGAHFRMDALAIFFLVIVNLAGGLASLYAVGHARAEAEPQRVLPFFPAFLAGMNLVAVADDAFTFLLAWEFMSLTSWALVMAEHHQSENTRAASIYLIMASFGTLALLLAFGLMVGPASGYTFTEMRHAEHGDIARAAIFILFLIGAGSKAGLVPLHVWLPLAHPAAPSHVSALMSGAMTKVATYALIRLCFDWLPAPAIWWSIVILIAGSVTALTGVLNALIERDLKRLLAFSTVENIGIIFVGLGLALAFEANGIDWAAALALTATLFHCLNHSLFKSLLFFGAGAVAHAAGLRDIERLGGLIHQMPRTSFVFLGGCLAIAALPPLNGFASEWLLLQAILKSPQLPQWSLKLFAPAAGVALALATALSTSCFVRAFGIAFLGRPRSDAAVRATETDGWSLAAMFVLLSLCLVAGILPGLVIDALSGVTHALVGDRLPSQITMPWLSVVPIAEGKSSYNGLLVFSFIVISTIFAVQMIHRFGSHALRRGPAWDCGYPDHSAATQYTADSFAQPIRRVLGGLAYGVVEKLEMPAPDEDRPARLQIAVTDRIWNLLYAPIITGVRVISRELNRLQFLTIRNYLSLVFAALVGLLCVVALWP
jgi:formate hydrogenlyase subunit 3/multisubunit Na+/H+ antiporter MnhD subunit